MAFSRLSCFVGASTIVSTLWPMDPDDGPNFAAKIYHAFHGQQVNGETDEKSFDQESGLKSGVSLARVIHEAVKVLRQRGGKKNAAYHWAAIYRSGFWLFPKLLVVKCCSARGVESTSRGTVCSFYSSVDTWRSARKRQDLMQYEPSEALTKLMWIYTL